MIERIVDKILGKPNRVIGGNYLHRWYLIPHNKLLNIYLHRFGRSDDDRALHDHPWYSVSFLLKGEMLEHHLNGRRHILRFLPVFRSAKFAHRLELVQGPVWTLFITGPHVRSWGFYCPSGWRGWREFGAKDGANVEKGCE